MNRKKIEIHPRSGAIGLDLNPIIGIDFNRKEKKK